MTPTLTFQDLRRRAMPQAMIVFPTPVFLHETECRLRRRDTGGGKSGCENEGPRLIDQSVDKLARTGDKSPLTPKRLGECSHGDVPAVCRIPNTDRMGIIHETRRIIVP